MIKTWGDVIKENKDSIYLFGYGSLLNKQTHENKHKKLIKARVKGFKRVFGLSYDKNKCKDKKYNERFKESSKYLGEDFEIKWNKLIYKKNSGSLTVCESKDSKLNGLLLEIKREDYIKYAEREYKYILKEINVELYDKLEEKEIENKKIYILLNKEELIDNVEIYYLYQKICRIGAYINGVDFGVDYDETTYDRNGNKAYEEINRRFFKNGKKVKITNNLITLNRFPELQKEIINNDGEIGIILDKNKYMIKIFILNKNKEMWIDQGDLSLCSNEIY